MVWRSGTVSAVTRRPEGPSPRDGLTVAIADIRRADEVADVVGDSDAVLSAVGVAYSRQPISVYSQGASNIVAGMNRHGVKRLVIVSSSALDPAYRPSDSFFYNRVLEPSFMRRPGRTTYDDMGRMETVVSTSELDWTIVRPCWLFNTTTVTNYHLAEGSANGMFTARSDLAAAMLAQLDDDRFVGKTIGVNTTEVQPRLAQQIWHETIINSDKEYSP